MEVVCNWQGGMKFAATNGAHEVSLDARKPIGTETAMNPKQLVLAGLGGCTAMDVASLMRKHKQEMTSFRVSTRAEMTEGGQPITFREFHLTFEVEGTVDREKLLEAVALSQTKYCGVSAMAIKAGPIYYRVILNREEIGKGQAKF
jgi:putative redox protein